MTPAEHKRQRHDFFISQANTYAHTSIPVTDIRLYGVAMHLTLNANRPNLIRSALLKKFCSFVVLYSNRATISLVCEQTTQEIKLYQCVCIQLRGLIYFGYKKPLRKTNSLIKILLTITSPVLYVSKQGTNGTQYLYNRCLLIT